MKAFGRGWALVVLLNGWSALAQEKARLCPAADMEQLRAEMQRQVVDQLAFFASWCLSCKKHIQTAGPTTLFVASFDDQDAVEATVKVLRGDGSLRCVWDRDNKIAQHYRVKSLPAWRQP